MATSTQTTDIPIDPMTGYDAEALARIERSTLKEPRVNTSEIYPVEYKVLVKLDPIETVSEGGIIMSVGTETDREGMAQVRGMLVAKGGNAFSDWKGHRPEPGDRVMIAKYAGLLCEGDDGVEYRLCNDKDIAAVLGTNSKGFRHDQRT